MLRKIARPKRSGYWSCRMYNTCLYTCRIRSGIRGDAYSEVRPVFAFPGEIRD